VVFIKDIIYSARILNHLAYCNSEEEKRAKQMNPKEEIDPIYKETSDLLVSTMSVGGWKMVHVNDVVFSEPVKKELGPTDPITLEDDEE
jgi:hypothetical protein